MLRTTGRTPAQNRKKPTSAIARTGRPRCLETQGAVLSAATRLLKKDGYGKLTIEGIAAEAGAGKQTIYRWWASKAEIVFEAYALDTKEAIPVADTGDWRADLESFLLFVVKRMESKENMIFRSLLSEALLDTEFARLFAARYMSTRVESIASILRRRRDYGAEQLAFAVDVIYGALWYRMVMGRPLSRLFVAQLVALADGVTAIHPPGGNSRL